MPRVPFALLFAVAAAAILARPVCARDAAEAAGPIDYERDIAPIFEDNCVYCHGEDESESGLRLDGRAWMLRGGDSGLPALVPGQPDRSYLLDLVRHVDPDRTMPPDEEQLPPEQIETLRRWIAEGAEWPGQMDATIDQSSDHWAFQPVTRPAVPERVDAPHPIDAFLAAKLDDAGLTFAPPAKPRDLIRRASIVLTGLIPAPEEVEAFVVASEADADAAYEVLVDRLLASPHFGERWAQHWLDVIRWAETNGSEANLYRKNAWIYRDYVVRAFNDDLPYDRFLREQIAGDTLGVGEATGFLVAGPHVPAATVGREPSAIRQARADRMDEVMQTVGASVMGLTVGCARCHNHKFDPLTIQDYYALTGVFQDVEFGSRRPEFGDNHPRQKRGDELRRLIEAERDQLRLVGGWEENWGAFRELHLPEVQTTAIRLRFKTNQVTLDELEVFTTGDDAENVALARSGALLDGYPRRGVENRNPIDRINDGEYGTMTWRAKVEPDATENAKDDGKPTDETAGKPWVVIDFGQPQTIERLRLSANREYFYDTDYLDKKSWLPRYEFDLDVRQPDGSWRPHTGTWHVNKHLIREHPARADRIAEIERLIAQLAEEGPRPSFVGRFVPPEPTRVLLRGSPEQPHDEVDPGGPALFGGDELGLTNASPGAARRAAFADWIASPDHPLTSRVAVNRLWHHTFGTGLVPTTSDFGKAGAPPSHPKLLDWLAAEFADPSDGAKPWSTKALLRRLVTTRAFRQSSQPRDDGLAADAGSALLWRFPPKRVEAEVIRDGVLVASGKLDARIGGRGYRIHNEKKTYAQWEVVDNHGPETWRRMLYQERMRRVDDGLFTAFDFPDCGQVRAKRPVSTTPLQALNLLNSAFVVEQSAFIAERAERETDSAAAAVDRCFALLLGRPPSDAERSACVDAAAADGLDAVCRALINTNEFAFLP